MIRAKSWKVDSSGFFFFFFFFLGGGGGGRSPGIYNKIEMNAVRSGFQFVLLPVSLPWSSSNHTNLYNHLLPVIKQIGNLNGRHSFVFYFTLKLEVLRNFFFHLIYYNNDHLLAMYDMIQVYRISVHFPFCWV